MKRCLLLICVFVAMSMPSFAQAVAGVTVNSIAVSGSTVTVTTATAHGLAVNQGFCLSAPANICAVVATTPTGTTQTFAVPAGQTVSACGSSCGTSTAAKQILILDTSAPTSNTWSVNVAFWLTTAQPIKTTASSVFTQVTAAENAAIAAGNFIEVRRNYTFATSYPTASVKAEIQADYTSAQATLASSIQPAQYYGIFYNGGWSQ